MNALVNHVAEPPMPPHCARAERAVLGALLAGASLVRDVDLKEDDFYLAAHRLIYRAMQSLVMQGKPVDIVTVLDAMTSAGTLADVGVNTLNGLAEAGPAKNIEAHATLVRPGSACAGPHAPDRDSGHLARRSERRSRVHASPITRDRPMGLRSSGRPACRHKCGGARLRA